jgi:hypothetical protein
MDDPVANGGRPLTFELLAKQVEDMIERGGATLLSRRFPACLGQDLAVPALGAQTWMAADPFDLALDAPLQPLARPQREELKLDAGTTRVEDEDRVAHGAS